MWTSRRNVSMWAVITVAAGALGCRASDRAIDAAVQADADVDAGAALDSGAEEDAGGGLLPTELPIGADDIRALHDTPGVDVYSVLLEDSLVFEHYDAEFSMGALWRVPVVDRLPQGAPSPLPIAAAVAGAPSVIVHDEKVYLYAVVAPDTVGSAVVERRRVESGVLGAPERLSLPDAITLLSWPRFVSLEGGEVAVAYRDAASVVKVAFSADGLRFGPAISMGPAGAQPELSQRSDGALVFTYQVGFGGDMQSYYRTSNDRVTWSEAALVTMSSRNVHDTDTFVRADGRIDLYYIYPDSPVGFDLWRRCIDGAETGPEQLVVERPWGNLAKPRAHRLRDGSILLTFVDQGRGHLLYATRLVGDAPCP